MTAQNPFWEVHVIILPDCFDYVVQAETCEKAIMVAEEKANEEIDSIEVQAVEIRKVVK